ncbi:hypothetical protein AAIB33_11070 [Microbacterium sp. AZCO]
MITAQLPGVGTLADLVALLADDLLEESLARYRRNFDAGRGPEDA